MRSPLPKVLHPLLGEPLISYPLRALFASGVKDVTIVVGHQAAEVEAAVRAFACRRAHCRCGSFYAIRATPGTGHTRCKSHAAFAAPAADLYLIASGDTPHIEAAHFSALQKALGELSVLVAEVDDAAGLGRVVLQGDRISRIVEERDADNETKRVRWVNAGAYAVQGDFLRREIQTLEAKNAQNELYLTDLVVRARGTAAAVRATEASATSRSA